MKKTIVGLFFVAIILSLYAPTEQRLGDSYKLIYFHLPLSLISFASLFLLPIATILNRRVLRLAFATVIFIIANLLLSALFMYLAWGGISTSEPRVTFNIFLLIMVGLFMVSLKISRYAAFLYSLVQIYLAYWLYKSVSEAPFQLHPISLVEMDITMKLPLLFTFPAFILVYYLLISRDFRKKEGTGSNIGWNRFFQRFFG